MLVTTCHFELLLQYLCNSKQLAQHMQLLYNGNKRTSPRGHWNWSDLLIQMVADGNDRDGDADADADADADENYCELFSNLSSGHAEGTHSSRLIIHFSFKFTFKKLMHLHNSCWFYEAISRLFNSLRAIFVGFSAQNEAMACYFFLTQFFCALSCCKFCRFSAVHLKW